MKMNLCSKDNDGDYQNLTCFRKQRYLRNSYSERDLKGSVVNRSRHCFLYMRYLKLHLFLEMNYFLTFK